MTSTDNRSSRSHGSRSRSSRSRARRVITHLWSEWRLEIIVLILIVLAIFLLVEQMQIRQTLAAWLRRAAGGVAGLAGRIVESVGNFVRATTLSDLTAYVLLLIAAGLVLWRVRWRLMHMSRFTERHCPRCGGDLHRIHRHNIDRLLHLFVPVRRYRCRDHACGWSGLRVHIRR